MVCCAVGAHALPVYLTAAVLRYPNIQATPLNSCSLCHSGGTNRNPYGQDFVEHSLNFEAIENIDSDDDGFTNIDEIIGIAFPGDPASVPSGPASISVWKPKADTMWVQGERIRVTWESTGAVGAMVTIELWRNGEKVKTLKLSTDNDGKQRVRVPANVAAGDGYSIRVKSTALPGVYGDSSEFTIQPPDSGS